MKDLQRKELAHVLKFIEALGCTYKVITDDGQEFGTLTVATPKSRTRRPSKFAYGEVAAWYKQHVNLFAVPGVVQEIPLGKFGAEDIRGGMCAWLTSKWGKGTYVTAVTKTHVEVMRTVKPQ